MAGSMSQKEAGTDFHHIEGSTSHGRVFCTSDIGLASIRAPGPMPARNVSKRPCESHRGPHGLQSCVRNLGAASQTPETTF